MDDVELAALEALEGSTPRVVAAAPLASVAAAAYARVPTRGPRDLQRGHRVVGILGRLGEAGARELVGLRERTAYVFPRQAIAKELARAQRELRLPAGELEDAFAGPKLDSDLVMTLPVGPCVAHVAVTKDLRNVQTTWTDEAGRRLRRQPAAARRHPDVVARLQRERRSLRRHLGDVRRRLDQAMTSERSWSVEDWATRHFADPLRVAASRRLIWRFDRDGGYVLALAQADGLRDVEGQQVVAPTDSMVRLWHPATSCPATREGWKERLASLDVVQPIDQVSREVTLPDEDSPLLDLGEGRRVHQRALRGYLISRGWKVPYLGSWFEVPEATHEESLAVLELEPPAGEADDTVGVGVLSFRSVQGDDLDARSLPAPAVSDAARDVLGALAAAGPS